MTYNAFGFKTISHIGTVDGSAGTMRSMHAYVTNDDAAAVETSGYFNAVADRIQTGDQLSVTLDMDATMSRRDYVMTNTAGVITISRDVSAVTGDQTAIAALTDNSTGTANDTIEVVGATNGGDVSGAINNNFADLAKKVNDLRSALIAAGLLAAS